MKSPSSGSRPSGRALQFILLLASWLVVQRVVPCHAADRTLSGATAENLRETAIAINPSNANEMVVAAMSAGPSLRVKLFSTRDGGAHWISLTLPWVGAGVAYSGDPALHWSADGRVWAVVSEVVLDAGPRFFLRIFRSDDSGKTWIYDSHRGDWPGDQPTLRSDASATSPYRGTAYVVSTSRSSTAVSRRPPGADWSAAVPLGSSTSTSDLATDTQGRVVVWQCQDDRLRVRRSVNGGVSFSAARVIAKTSCVFSFPGNRGGSFTIPSGGTGRVGDAEKLYVIWNNPSRQANLGTRTWFSRSSDGGVTWEKPRTINASPGDQFQASLHVDAAGSLYVSYYQRLGNLQVQRWLLRSSDGGSTWSIPFLLGSQPTAFDSRASSRSLGDYQGIAGAGSSIVAVWSDRRGSAPAEVWFRHVDGNRDLKPPAAARD